MLLEPIISLFIIRYLRRHFQTKTTLPKWDKLLLAGVATAITLIVASVLVQDDNPLILFPGHALAFALVYIVYRHSEFSSARPFIYSVIPILIISLIVSIVQIVAPGFYSDKEDYFDIAIMFAILWVVTMWLITKKQRKALEQEREQMARMQREQMITEKVKAELELQVLERTAALTLQKEELEKTLSELKATQSQLIQSEKMASLGELTAGIAHEIQNPLNFVNNFAEVNTELIAELKEERQKPERDPAHEEQLLSDIAENSLKITHHGKRADGIVKGMLQHSRSSNGVKEPTDINELADEYLRLAYHGLRAKDKTFNATLKTDFDQSIGMINLVPQDIGRVILNLITNAFYAVGERKKTSPDFQPVVEVTTKKKFSNGPKRQPIVEIKISDNGNGIPQHILDRIFQPFFTTKPTGEGTGLGLSLSYDIVKAHGGKLNLETVHADSAGDKTPGTTFILELPA